MTKSVSGKCWLEVVSTMAAGAGISTKKVLTRTKNRKVTAVRHAAFEVLLSRGHSAYAIALASGFHKSTVMYCGDKVRRKARCASTLARYYRKKAETACEQPQRLAA